MTVRAMKAGVVKFLTKPFRDQELDAIEVAIERDRIRASNPAGGFTLALVLEQLRRGVGDSLFLHISSRRRSSKFLG